MSRRSFAGAAIAAGLVLTSAAAASADPSAGTVSAQTAGSEAHGGAYFRDAFNFEAPGWRNVVGRWSVRDDNLVSTGMAGRFSSVAHINTYDDFDYEVRMNRKGNSDGRAPNCLIVRGNSKRVANDLWLPGYYFCYTNNGQALIVAFDRFGKRRELMDYTPVVEIGTGSGYRTARVEAIGPLFSYYVNGKLIWSGRDQLATSGQVGVGFYVEPGKRGSLAMDYANLGPVKARPAH